MRLDAKQADAVDAETEGENMNEIASRTQETAAMHHGTANKRCQASSNLNPTVPPPADFNALQPITSPTKIYDEAKSVVRTMPSCTPAYVQANGLDCSYALSEV